MGKSIKMQLKYTLGRKKTFIVFIIIILFVLANIITNLIMYNGMERTQMYCPVKLSSLSEWTAIHYYLLQFYPLIVIAATSTLFIDDCNSRMVNYIQSRIGYRKYIYGKIISVFILTMLLFTIPFILEIIIYRIIIPLCANGDPSGMSYIESPVWDEKFVLYKLLYFNRYLYAIVMIVFFGIISGIFAVFNIAISMVGSIKYKIFTYIPLYALFYMISLITQFINNIQFKTNYLIVLGMFKYKDDLSYPVYGVFIAIVLAISLCIVEIRIRRGKIV